MHDTEFPDSRGALSGKLDARVRRTRGLLLDAFNLLVLTRRKRDIRVADIVNQARVGRSTFYDHYPSAEALHLEALKRPFGPLAEAAAGRGGEAALAHILAHFWEYRSRARRTFSARTEGLLAAMVEERLAGAELTISRRLAARQLAAAAHAPILAWLSGQAPARPGELARAICRSGEAQLRALTR